MRCPKVLAVVAAAALLAGCSSAEPGAGPGDGTDSGAPADAANRADASLHEAGTAPEDGGGGDSGPAGDAGDAGDAGTIGDAGGDAECVVFSVGGQCILVSSCMALVEHTSYSGYCPGPADIECCVDTHNEPTPAGWAPMQDTQVTPPMTTWAVAILNDPATYPMYSTTTKTFATQLVLARVEWHPPDTNNNVVHRGVTLYLPAD